MSRAGIEYRIVRPDGETRWIYALGAAARDEDGNPQAVHGIHLDITDRKQAEDDLDLMRRHLELAIEGAQLGVWSYRSACRILLVLRPVEGPARP